MIKNIVFDLGNVLLSFVPSEYLIKKNYPDNIRNTILRDIFQSTEWKMLDNGDITVPEAIESIAAKSSLKREEIALVFNFRRDIMFPSTITPNCFLSSGNRVISCIIFPISL